MPFSGVTPNQVFSRTNGTNTGDQTWQSDDAQSVGIVSSRHDTHDQDLSDGINSCLKKDGGNAATANLPMGGFKHTNVGDAAARTQYATFGQLQDGATIYYRTVGGSVDAITLTDSVVAISAYAAGQRFLFKATGTSTSTTPTINIDGVGAATVTRNGGGACSPGDIRSGAMVTIEHDGTNFQMTGAVGASLDSGTTMPFVQTAAPTGWTKSTTHNDKALRIVSGTASTGGSTAFSSIFAARTIAAGNLPDHTVSITDPGHTHTGTTIGQSNNLMRGDGSSDHPFSPSGSFGPSGSNINMTTVTTGITAAFGTTARGGAQTAVDFAVAYVDCILAVKI